MPNFSPDLLPWGEHPVWANLPRVPGAYRVDSGDLETAYHLQAFNLSETDEATINSLTLPGLFLGNLYTRTAGCGGDCCLPILAVHGPAESLPTFPTSEPLTPGHDVLVSCTWTLNRNVLTLHSRWPVDDPNRATPPMIPIRYLRGADPFSHDSYAAQVVQVVHNRGGFVATSNGSPIAPAVPAYPIHGGVRLLIAALGMIPGGSSDATIYAA